MPGMPLSPEIVRRITQLASTRRGDLYALCLTCKAFQREAEVRLYDALLFSEPQKAHQACRTIIEHERLALLVHTFWFAQESRRPLPLGQPFWLSIRSALNRMHNLECLVLFDSSFSNTWVFDPAQIRFQLREAKLRFTWDVPLVRFLEMQPKLRLLATYDNLNDSMSVGLLPGRLPVLEVFDGTFMVGMQLVHSPLTHMQLIVDREHEVMEQVLDLLPQLSGVHKTLRGLSILDLPEELASKSLRIISNACPVLRHVGLIPFPVTNVRFFYFLTLEFIRPKISLRFQRHKIHDSLMRLHYLRSIQLDISRWNPPPGVPAQRALAAELKVFCPTIKHVAFWIHGTRFRWHFSNDWRSQVDAHLYPQMDPMWNSA